MDSFKLLSNLEMPVNMERRLAENLPEGVNSSYIQVGDITTHYLEAKPASAANDLASVLLVHSGEFGARAEFSWRYSIAELGKHFRVVAPDMVGFGRTDLVHSFTDTVGFRAGHLRRFLASLGSGPVHLVGNSFGGGLVLQMAAKEEWGFHVRSVIVVSGGGRAPDNDARKLLTGYDGKREEMQEILRVLFYDERWWADDLVEERWQASREPGIWEACAVARLAPKGEVRGFRPVRPDYGKIRCPVFIMGGADDLLRFPSYVKELQEEIPGSQGKVFERSRHCSHIEHAEAFNSLAIDFFKNH